MVRALTNVIGFDDAPFSRGHRGPVLVVGAIFSKTRLDGVLSSQIEKDGFDATNGIAALVQSTRYRPHIRAILFKGIALGGFNVVDLPALHAATGLPVLVVARRPPRLERMKRSLGRLPEPARRWAMIEAAGEMERIGELWVQRAGLERALAEATLEATTLHGNVPECLRVAHLIAGGVTTGVSRGRA